MLSRLISYPFMNCTNNPVDATKNKILPRQVLLKINFDPQEMEMTNPTEDYEEDDMKDSVTHSTWL